MKIIISGLILLGLLCQLAACGESDSVSDSTDGNGDAADSSETTSTETTVDYTLPETKNYGRSFTI